MSDFVVASVLNGMAKGMVQGMELKGKQQAAAEQARLKQEELIRKRENHLINKVKHAYQFGGTDPLSGKQIPVEESQAFRRRELDKLSFESKQLQLQKLREEVKRGAKLSVNETDRVAEGGDIFRQVNDLRELVKNNPDVFGYSAGIKKNGATRALAELGQSLGVTGSDELLGEHTRLNRIAAQLKMTSQRLARTIEKGRMSDADRAFYLGIMADIWDRPELALGKLTDLRDDFLNKHNDFLDLLERKGVKRNVLGENLTIEQPEDRTPTEKQIETGFDIDNFLGE